MFVLRDSLPLLVALFAFFGCDSKQYLRYQKQECIPVGCVPSAEVTFERGCLPRGCVSAQGVCVCPGGVSAGGGVCPGGVFLVGCLPGGCLPQCMLGYTPPVNRMTDACENITFPQR